jgi:hypothetical protein
MLKGVSGAAAAALMVASAVMAQDPAVTDGDPTR